MKYYYGHSMKEALSNSPVEIKGTKQYEQYKEYYPVLIPCDDVPPTEAEMDIDSCLADEIEDTDYVEEVINDYLSDEYGWCVNSYNWEIVKDKIKITDIDWDLTSEY